jgi:malonate-semialdehyde dehydrogenase (acetylating)/methylmalonate-semialdehyde dehydrogenase
MKRIGHWIDGRSVEGTSGRTGPVYNPALGQQVAEVDLASAAEVDLAVESAHNAFPAWGATGLSRRSEILFRMRELSSRTPKARWPAAWKTWSLPAARRTC